MCRPSPTARSIAAFDAQIAAASQTATAPLAVDGAGQQAGNGARTTATATFAASQLNTDIRRSSCRRWPQLITSV